MICNIKTNKKFVGYFLEGSGNKASSKNQLRKKQFLIKNRSLMVCIIIK